MSVKTLGWKVAVITGSAGGLGRALAIQFIKEKKEIILVGRTESSLKKTAQEIGAKAYYVADVGDVASLPAVTSKILKEHPEVDCLVNNAGIMKIYNLDGEKEGQPDWGAEINININGVVKLTQLFTPHLKTKPNAAIMNITSGLAYFPWSAYPVYCGTKAFIKSFTVSVRHQLKDTSVNVIEIAPPLVETDIHRDRPDKDNFKASNNPGALTQEDFIAQVFEGLKAGRNEIGAGRSNGLIQQWRGLYDGPLKTLNPGESAEWAK